MRMVIMSKISILMLVIFLPVKMQILWTWLLNLDLLTTHIPRIFTRSRMVLLNILVLVASFCLDIILVSECWLLQQGDEQIPRKKSKKDFFH